MKKEIKNTKKAVVTTLKVKSGVKAGPVVLDVMVVGPNAGRTIIQP